MVRAIAFHAHELSKPATCGEGDDEAWDLGVCYLSGSCRMVCPRIEERATNPPVSTSNRSRQYESQMRQIRTSRRLVALLSGTQAALYALRQGFVMLSENLH